MNAKDLLALRMCLRAEENVELPCLPTTMIRSVFGQVLREMTCSEPHADRCHGCPVASACPYAILFEPTGDAARDVGVTQGAPPPLIIAPEAPVTSDAPIHLPRDARMNLRVVLVGDARAHAETVVAAMRAAVARGLGRRRAAMVLDSAEPTPVTLTSAGPAVEVELITPLRMTSEGKVRSLLTAQQLLTGIVRRVDTLDKLYGHAATSRPPGDGADGADVDLEVMGSRRIHVRRWSSRQKASMQLPGTVGKLLLRGDLGPWWHALALGEWLQVGKGTSMGFGRYRLRPVQE